MTLHFRVHFVSDLEPPRSITVIAFEAYGAMRLAKIALRQELGDERAGSFHVDEVELRCAAHVDLRGAA